MIGPPIDHNALRDVERFLAMPAPREVPPELKKRLKLMKGSKAVCGFGLLFGTFGLVFCFLFLPLRQFHQWFLDGSSPVEMPGKVVSNESTHLSINGVSVRKVEVDFQIAGEDRRSTGYITGKGPKPGSALGVRVHPGRPDLHCPQGMRMSRGSLGAAFVLVFPLLGYGLALAPWWGRARRLGLLRNGRLVQAKVLSAERTRTEINGQNVFKFTLQWLREPGTIQIRRHLESEVEALTYAKEVGEPVRLVQHPTRPKRLMVLEGWV
ncbi:MAG: hypothetical protein MUF31_10085 [Akkermansiaceae bacterium]|jgi:hypothetical protein|nr:hypothetical protein [Akkermansiaceae bacterium]